jgi:hypothetical protein
MIISRNGTATEVCEQNMSPGLLVVVDLPRQLGARLEHWQDICRGAALLISCCDKGIPFIYTNEQGHPRPKVAKVTCQQAK